MNQPHKLLTILLGSATIAIVQPQIAIAQLSPQQVDSIAREVTVRIDGSGGGSGVIIERQGDTYFVLTNHHVVRQPDRYEIQTPDGQRYPFYYGKELPGFDLALIQFTSNKNYRVAQLGNSDQLRAEASVYAAGFPVPQPGIEKRLYKFTAGKFVLYQPGGDNGYTMVYNNEVIPGMSGGPILDGMGRVVGVNGRFCNVRLGIPINSFLANKGKLRQLRDASADETRPPSPEDWLSSGRGKANNKDYRGAIADYNKALQICPDNIDAYYSLGYAQYQLKNYQAVIENSNQVLRINPNNAFAYFFRGVTYDKLKEYQKAIADYNQAIRLDPNYAYAYNNRGNAYGTLKEYEKAIADFNQAIRLDPNYTYAYNNRGNTYLYLKEYQKAIADFNQAIRLDPNHTNAYYNRGITYYHLKEYEQAIADYNQAIRLAPNLACAYKNRGAAYNDLKEYEQAIADYNQAIRLDPNDAMAYYNRGLIYRNQGDNQAALSDFQKAANLYQQQGRQDDYQDAINRIRELQR